MGFPVPINMKNHYTYCIFNMLNGKMYIGCRSCECPPEMDKKYMGSCKTLKKAIKEDGLENFVKCLLEVHPTRKKAISHEIRLHHRYDVAVNPLFYNQAKQTGTGFDRSGKESSFKGHRHTMESNEANRQKHIGKTPNKGKKWSEEVRRNMSEAKIGMYAGKNNPMYGKNHSEETKRKIAETQRKRLSRIKNGNKV